MAEGKEIVIKIINEKSSNMQKKVDVTGDGQEKSTDDIFDNAIMNHIIKKSARQLVGVAVSEVKYKINRHFMLTDDYLGEQNLNIAANVVSKIWEFGVSIYSGAKIGASIGGGYGAAAGAILAAVVDITQTVQDISHNYEQERIRLNQMNANLSFNRQRAGYSLTAGSIGENR